MRSSAPATRLDAAAFLLELARRCAVDPREYWESQPRILAASLYAEHYLDAPDEALEEAEELNRLGARLTRPSPPAVVRRRLRSPDAQWLVQWAAAGPTKSHTALGPGVPQDLLARGRVRAYGIFAASALEFAARYQFPVPCWFNHGDHARTSNEFVGYFDRPSFERDSGRAFARLNVASRHAQQQITDKLRAGTPQCVSMQVRAYREEETWMLFEQFQAIDLVERGDIPSARVLGPWAERGAVMCP